MNKPQVIVLNNIGGGFDILVHRLPHANETVMMHGMLMSEDLAKGGNVAVALSRLGVPTAIIGKIGCDVSRKNSVYVVSERNGVFLVKTKSNDAYFIVVETALV